MKAPLREQLRSQVLPEDDLSEVEQQLLQHLLDKELAAKWSTKLADQGLLKTPSTPLILKLRPWLIAASVLLIGVVAWWVWSFSRPQEQVLANEFLKESFALNEGFFRDDDGLDPQLKSSLAAYQKGDFPKALADISALIDAGQAKAADFYLAALCHLYSPQPNYAAATSLLLKARQSDSARFSDEISWYLSLAYIKQKSFDKATTELQTIVAGNTSRNIADAKVLLELLAENPH